ncbi:MULTISPECIES: hypothetical protein [unclassified Bradyrhizobium]|uniref:hypothetical protein n=2 Tax=Bradyrhizobium TaxID=374 RepID=UPI0028E3421A|nr:MULTISPECIES: hypothetical protein [unclassified Bradyrhizobium]
MPELAVVSRVDQLALFESPASMTRPPAASAFRTVLHRASLAGLAASFLLCGPAHAQDSGTSGIPLGPANINGLNGSVRDPSGIGNAARIPPLPQPNLAPVPVPSVAPLNSTQPVYSPRLGYARQWRHLSKRQRAKLERQTVKENDRLLRYGVPSICRGC